MRLRLATLLTLLALLGGACGSGDNAATTATTHGSDTGKGAQTIPIGVDARTEGFASSWIHFFPHEVKAHPGDTLEFTSTFTGEPHTVAFGTLINEGLEAFAKVDKDHPGPPPPEVQTVLDKIPSVLEQATGPDDALFVQAASQPCYLADDEPPTKEACPKDSQKPPKEITGKERFLNSGFLPDQARASFKLADSMAPGDYTFMCLVHGPEMTEKVTVVDKATAVPGTEQVKAEGRMHLDEFVAKVKAQAAKVQSSTAAAAPAGGRPEDRAIPSAGINVFPKEITVKPGEKVTWTVDGFHVIAFNAPEDARPWLQFDDAGVLVGNKKSLLPAASPPIPDPPKPAAASQDGSPPLVPVDAGTWDGQGFHASGAPFPDARLQYSLAFSKPGTYRYLCLVHPDMEGTVKVT